MHIAELSPSFQQPNYYGNTRIWKFFQAERLSSKIIMAENKNTRLLLHRFIEPKFKKITKNYIRPNFN